MTSVEETNVSFQIVLADVQALLERYNRETLSDQQVTDLDAAITTFAAAITAILTPA